MTELPLPRPRVARQRETQPPTVAIALFVGFVLTAAFIGLAAVVIPGVLLMVLAGFGMLLFFVLQYFLWARWLYPIAMKKEAVSPFSCRPFLAWIFEYPWIFRYPVVTNDEVVSPPDNALPLDKMPKKHPEPDP